MNVVMAIGKFLYSLLVGDSWPLTLAMVVVLSSGVAVAEMIGAPSVMLALGMAVAAPTVASLTVLVEARLAHRAASYERTAT